MAPTQPITPLRQRMLDDMKLRNMALSTRKIYVASVAGFSAYHGRSPDQLTLEDVRDYQLHLVARGLKASSICPIMTALRFFYGTTLGHREAAAEIPLPRKADPLPAILSQDEVQRLLAAVPDRQMRTLLTTVTPRPARLRGRRAPGRRHRRRPDDHPRPRGQGRAHQGRGGEMIVIGRGLRGQPVPVLRRRPRLDPARPRPEPADRRSGRGQLPQGGHHAAAAGHARLRHEGRAAGRGGGRGRRRGAARGTASAMSTSGPSRPSRPSSAWRTVGQLRQSGAER